MSYHGELFEVGEQKYAYTGLAAAILEDIVVGRVCHPPISQLKVQRKCMLIICSVAMITSPFRLNRCALASF